MAKIDEKITVLTNKGALSGIVVKTDEAGNPVAIRTGRYRIFERADSGIYYCINEIQTV